MRTAGRTVTATRTRTGKPTPTRITAANSMVTQVALRVRAPINRQADGGAGAVAAEAVGAKAAGM